MDNTIDVTHDAKNYERLALGDFHLLREIGRGGMGVVYEAEQLSLARHVAVKVLPFASLLNHRSLERFKNEARAAAMLKHPNVVNVHSVGFQRGIHFYAMELVDGQSVADLIMQMDGTEIETSRSDVERSTAMDPGESDDVSPIAETRDNNSLATQFSANRKEFYRGVARLGQQVATGLHFAHQHGVIHRDIKPSNLLLDGNGQLKVADFGLARIQNAEELTFTGDVVGTLHYMSPEQIENQPFDQRTDVYSLGVTLYELLTRQRPFKAIQRHQLIQEILEKTVVPVDRHDRHVPQDLATIISKCMCKEPIGRYNTAQELSEDLQRFLENRPVMAHRPSVVDYAGRWIRRNPIIATLGLFSFLLLLAMAIGGPYIAVKQLTLSRSLLQSRDRLRAELYDKDISVAFAALEAGDLHQVDTILTRYEPKASDKDRRSFEWNYLWHQSRRGLKSPLLQDWLPINAVATSPAGEYLALGNLSGVVSLVDTDSNKEIWKSTHQEGHGSISMVDFSWDGKILASLGITVDQISFRDTATGRVLTQSNTLENDVEAFAFAPTENLIALAHGDGTLRSATSSATIAIYRWKPDHENDPRQISLEPVWQSKDHTGEVGSLAFSADSKLLAAGSTLEPIVSVWDTSTGEDLTQLRIPGRGAYAIDFSPTSPTLLAIATCSNSPPISTSEVLLWTVGDEAIPVGQEIFSQIRDVCFSHDGRRLAACGVDRSIRIWNVESLETVDNIRGHSGAVNEVSFLPSGKTLVSVADDNALRSWNVEHRAAPSFVKAHRSHVCSLAFDPSGRYLASCGDGAPYGDVEIRDVLNGRKLFQSFDAQVRSPRALSISPDGRTLAGGGGSWPNNGKGRLNLWDVKSGRLLHTLQESGAFVWSAVFSPDSRQLATGIDGDLVFWDVATGKHISKVPTGHRTVRYLVWSVDGSLIATCSGKTGGTVNLWDASTKECIWQHRYTTHHGHAFASLAISRDNRFLAASGFIKDILVWEIESGRSSVNPYRVLKGHTNAVLGIDFSHDGRRLASASHDSTVRLWNLESGTELTSFREPNGWCWTCKFSPDGDTLAVGCGADFSGGWLRFFRASAQAQPPVLSNSSPSLIRTSDRNGPGG